MSLSFFYGRNAKKLTPDDERSTPDVFRFYPTFWSFFATERSEDLDYDKLQNLAEEHRSLRQLMQIGDWDQPTSFDWRRIQATLTQLKPETIQSMNQVIVAYGQDLHGDARREVRADSLVIETNIHYPTESSLIYDGIRKTVALCVRLASDLNQTGWRQAEHLTKQIKKIVRNISRIAASKSAGAVNWRVVFFETRNSTRWLTQKRSGLLTRQCRVRYGLLPKSSRRKGLELAKCMPSKRLQSERKRVLLRRGSLSGSSLDLSCDGSDYLGISGELSATRKPT